MEENKLISHIEERLNNCEIKRINVGNANVISSLVSRLYNQSYNPKDYKIHVINLELDNPNHILYGQFFLARLDLCTMFYLLCKKETHSNVDRTYELLGKAIEDFNDYITNNLNFDFVLEEYDETNSFFNDNPIVDAPKTLNQLIDTCGRHKDFEAFVANCDRLFSSMTLVDGGCQNVRQLLSIFDIEYEPVLSGIETVNYNIDFVNEVIFCNDMKIHIDHIHSFNEIKHFLIFGLVLNSIKYDDRSYVKGKFKNLSLIKSNSIMIDKEKFTDIRNYSKSIKIFPKNTLSPYLKMEDFINNQSVKKNKFIKNISNFFSVVYFDTSNEHVKEFVEISFRNTGNIVKVGDKLCFCISEKEIYFEDNDCSFVDPVIFDNMLYYFFFHMFLNETSLFKENSSATGLSLPIKYNDQHDFNTLMRVVIDQNVVNDFIIFDYEELQSIDVLQESILTKLVKKIIKK